MHSSIQIRNERVRGCGYRKPGGLYLVCEGEGMACGRLPIALHVCPTCGSGFKQSRGFTWLDLDKLAATEHCTKGGTNACKACPLSQSMGRVGLLWVGRENYKTPQQFTKEAVDMGISRRISQVPRDFKVGETWIALAHAEVVKNPEPMPVITPDIADDDELSAEIAEQKKEYKEMLPGIFHMFKPSRIEYVVRPEEANDAEFIEGLIKRGITPVHVQRIGESDDMFDMQEMNKPCEKRDVYVRKVRTRKGRGKKKNGKK